MVLAAISYARFRGFSLITRDGAFSTGATYLQPRGSSNFPLAAYITNVSTRSLEAQTRGIYSIKYIHLARVTATHSGTMPEEKSYCNISMTTYA